MDIERGKQRAAQGRESARRTGEQVQQSKPFEWLVTLGLICYGLIHLLLGWLCVQVALGGGGETSTKGALADLVAKPFGNVLMIIIAVGLFALVVLQLLEALFGYQQMKRTKKMRKKVSSAARAIVYAGLGVSAIVLAMGGRSGDSNESAKGATATLMSAPFGQVLVGLVGGVIIAVGVSQIVKGVRRKFAKEDLAAGVSEWAKKLGTVGWIVKGLSIALVGVLFVWAAITFDPQKAAGVDGALKTLQDQPFGQILLILMGLGFVCFGVYCFLWSRNVNHESI